MKQYIVDAFTDKLFAGNQASERTGVLYAKVNGDRVKISGKAVLYSTSELEV